MEQLRQKGGIITSYDCRYVIDNALNEEPRIALLALYPSQEITEESKSRKIVASHYWRLLTTPPLRTL